MHYYPSVYVGSHMARYTAGMEEIDYSERN